MRTFERPSFLRLFYHRCRIGASRAPQLVPKHEKRADTQKRRCEDLTKRPEATIIMHAVRKAMLSESCIFMDGPVAQLGERTVQFYAPKFGDVAQASGRWFASMPPKKSIRACSSAGRAFGSHPRGREFESLQVHQNVRNFLIFAEDSELFCIFQNQALSTVVILPPFGSHPTQSRLKSLKETRNSTSNR